MSDAPRRFWPNPQADRHILGEIRKIKQGDTSVSALVLYEQSVGRGDEPPVTTPTRGTIIGADRIRCTICGRVHDWIIDQAILNEQPSKPEPVSHA
jgi:hypothetical protein